jgi:hypothetical protein
MNQLDRIMELTGRPSGDDLEAISSPFAATMMESCSVTQAKRLADLFPHASRDAADLLVKLLQVCTGYGRSEQYSMLCASGPQNFLILCAQNAQPQHRAHVSPIQ